MSRHPSPVPSQHLHSQSQMYHQIPLNTSAGSSATRLRTKPYVAGITAGAEDVKYQAKHKELKKKVKEIESDNDRLYLKLLLAKKNIRRMNLERAILYERLAQVPPTPGRHTQELPLEGDPVFVQQLQGPAEHSRAVDVDDRILEDYLRSNPNARVIQRPDGKVVAIEDPAVHTRGALGLSGPPPPHGIPIVRGFGYESGGPAGYDGVNDRQLPPPLPIPAIREPPQPYESPRIANNRSPVYQPEPVRHSQTHHSMHSSHSHSHSHSSSHRTRGSSSRQQQQHDLDLNQGELGRLDTLPPAHGHVSIPVPGHSRSSSLSGEGQVEPRSRRHDIHELTHPHGGPVIPHPRVDIPAPNLPPSPTSGHSPTHGRTHNHQRIGPGVHLHRQQERDPEVTRQLLREREKEKEREREREIEYQQRRAAEEEELRSLAPWPQHEDAPLTGPGVSRARSRSDTPGSGGGGGGGGGGVGPSRPDSGQSYERDQRHSYAAPRITNLLSHPTRDTYYDARDDRMGGHVVSHSRSYPSEYGSGMESRGSSRKRSRHDMEIDDGGEMRSPLEGGSRSAGSVDSYGM